MNKIDKILLGIAIILVLFIITMIITFWKFQSVPDVLITCVCGGSLGEAVATCVIKVYKEKNKTDKE